MAYDDLKLKTYSPPYNIFFLEKDKEYVARIKKIFPGDAEINSLKVTSNDEKAAKLLEKRFFDFVFLSYRISYIDQFGLLDLVRRKNAQQREYSHVFFHAHTNIKSVNDIYFDSYKYKYAFVKYSDGLLLQPFDFYFLTKGLKLYMEERAKEKKKSFYLLNQFFSKYNVYGHDLNSKIK